MAIRHRVPPKCDKTGFSTREAPIFRPESQIRCGELARGPDLWITSILFLWTVGMLKVLKLSNCFQPDSLENHLDVPASHRQRNAPLFSEPRPRLMR